MIGFAAETERVRRQRQAKLARKGCDFIIANSVAEGTGTFGGASNEVHLIGPEGVEAWPRMSKEAVAGRIISSW